MQSLRRYQYSIFVPEWLHGNYCVVRSAVKLRVGADLLLPHRQRPNGSISL